MNDIRIGHGYDIHRLESREHENFIMLGGVKIPFEKSFIAHSDGDVVIHAVIDALLGAAGLGDIGQHFPDTDPKYHNADSRGLLCDIVNKITSKGYKLNNLDVTVIAQKPKLSPHLAHMQEILSADLNISMDRVNLKAKTNEGCDAIGRCEAIAVNAVVSIISANH